MLNKIDDYAIIDKAGDSVPLWAAKKMDGIYEGGDPIMTKQVLECSHGQ
jgi:hypothetical protein